MKLWRRAALTTAVGALAFAGVAASASAEPSGHDRGRASAATFAVIGDIPYGDAQIASFNAHIDQINADRGLRFVQHLGDIKSGSGVCSDAYFSMIKSDFDRFTHPFIYAIGDNEWTDCHRANNGSYNPLERLSALRKVFFANPNRTLGTPSAPVQSQAKEGYPEESRYEVADVSFASLHVVGSNNSLAPWTGKTAPTPEQSAEALGRTADSIQVIRDAFATARQHHDRAVALMLQADMFDPTVTSPSYADNFAFTPIVQAIAQESRDFGKPVYLFNGDSHVYNDDHPLAAGSSWLSFYGVSTAVPNLTRVTVDGSTGVNNYLKVTVVPSHGHPAPSDPVLSWVRVPFTTP